MTTRPEPVTKAGLIAGLVALVLAGAGLIARAFGWIADDVDVIAVANRASDVVLGAAGLWATLAPIALAVRARAHVTPLADPRDAAGRVLAALTDPADELGTDVRDLLAELLDELRAIEPAVVEHQVDEHQVDELGPPTAPLAAIVADTTGRHGAPETAGA